MNVPHANVALDQNLSHAREFKTKAIMESERGGPKNCSELHLNRRNNQMTNQVAAATKH